MPLRVATGQTAGTVAKDRMIIMARTIPGMITAMRSGGNDRRAVTWSKFARLDWQPLRRSAQVRILFWEASQ